MKLLLIVLLFSSAVADAQMAYNFLEEKPNTFPGFIPHQSTGTMALKRTLYQRNTGMILGLQKGKYTSIELGGEAHWRKISLLRPRIVGVTANMEYNFEENVVGYKAGVWAKKGRINLTYGANLSYFTDFNNRYLVGIGPSIGFRFFGFHIINGYNFFVIEKKQKEALPLPANTLYMSLRYYFPVQNKFTWDRETMKKKKARKQLHARRKKERIKNEKKHDKKTKPF